MNTTSRKQSGFSTVEGLLIVIIVLLVGFIGYYVWHTQKNDDKKASTATSSQTTQKSSNTSKTTTPPANTQYLVIKEWGVKIPLSSTISTAYYSYNSSIDMVTLSLDKYKGTNCATDQGQLYGIARSTDPSSGGEDSTATGVKIAGYYYFAVHPQAGCDGGPVNESTTDTAGSNEAISYLAPFKDAIDHIVAN